MEISSTLSDSEIKPRPTGKGALFYLIFTWGVAGVLLLFGRALWRLTPMAWQPIADGSLSAMQIGLYVAWVAFNAYSEGYRAFQKAFCPRVVGRAYHLAQNPTLPLTPVANIFPSIAAVFTAVLPVLDAIPHTSLRCRGDGCCRGQHRETQRRDHEFAQSPHASPLYQALPLRRGAAG